VNHDERLRNFYLCIMERRGDQKAIVATANKMLKIIWTMLMSRETYRNADERRYGKKLKKHWRTTVIAGLRGRKKSGSPAEAQRLS
jgi:hypothetical protein